ncbi:MAG TPA: hypothetical protein VGD67_26680 [Pseudonocardiaceae bacterium]
MSQFTNILCRSGDAPARAALADFAEESWYEDEPLEFAPGRGATDQGGTDGTVLEIRLPGRDRPVVVRRDTAADAVAELVREAVEELGGNLTDDLRTAIEGTRQVIGIEFFPETLDEDGWELLDTITAHLARELDGLVMADDGLYDRELEKLLDR